MDSSSSSLHGFQLGKLMLRSGLLQNSWSKISEIYNELKTYPNQASGLRIEIYEEAKYTLVVFVASQSDRNCSGSTLLSGPRHQNPFHFLCSEKKSSFSLHQSAYQLFASAYRTNLSQLKSKLLKSEKPVILTGAALGGSVASLFTLWLFETIDPKRKRPLCITFGSPLIVDADLQQILENSVMNSCFLHMVMAAETRCNTDFKPFGTFLICSDSECICIEEPETIMELLTGDKTDPIELTGNNTHPIDLRDYGEILQRLDQSSTVDSGLMIDGIMERMEERVVAKNSRKIDQLKQLNKMKIVMAYMENYKKFRKTDKIGYYDRFKTENSIVTEKAKEWKKELNEFWISMVEEVRKMPQTEKSILKKRCLLSGNNYRRMIEPLDIAEHYRDSDLHRPTEYQTLGRSRHYDLLEKWFNAENKQPFRCKDRDLSHLLMFDSCFWAEVEESLIVLNQLRATDGMTHERKVLLGKLARFEKYVWKMIEKREVSPEIFWENSSFMTWWKGYKEIKSLDSSPSDFMVFMNTRKYERYGQSIVN